eukprot:TRINITY_DN11537_c1_g1_i1.p1 TRINITY_DN11537_c1_g1~~TRINITY_DN11537_c1_g1_i1.p1  ORF type:complete len:413 (+),score=44.12 TRINITY_DN11537_c1_g1_i1:536-1774(+)
MAWEERSNIVELKCQDIEKQTRVFEVEDDLPIFEFKCGMAEQHYGLCKVMVENKEVTKDDERTCGSVCKKPIFIVNAMRGAVADDGKRGMAELLPAHALKALKETVLSVDTVQDIYLSVGGLTEVRHVSGGAQRLASSVMTRDEARAYFERFEFSEHGIAVSETSTSHRISVVKIQDCPVGYSLRFSRLIGNLCDPLMEYITKRKKILIVGPSGCGKTTLLRDLIRVMTTRLSVGCVDFMGEVCGSGELPHLFAKGAKRFVYKDRTEFSGVLSRAVRYYGCSYLVVDGVFEAVEVEGVRAASYSGTPLVVAAQSANIASLLTNPDTTHLMCERQVSPFSTYDPKGPNPHSSQPKGPFQIQSNPHRKINHLCPIFDVILEMQTPTSWRVTTQVSKVIDAIVNNVPYDDFMEFV